MFENGRLFLLSAREKDPDHEETLAHLAALAVHLENEGKPDEAFEIPLSGRSAV
jgi:hypothetical protein